MARGIILVGVFKDVVWEMGSQFDPKHDCPTIEISKLAQANHGSFRLNTAYASTMSLQVRVFCVGEIGVGRRYHLTAGVSTEIVPPDKDRLLRSITSESAIVLREGGT